MSDTLAGKFLVAMPGIGDPRFERTVIIMCAHDSEHAMGVVVNKPKGLSISTVLDHLGLDPSGDIAERAVLDGGPVRPDRGFVLHSEDYGAGDATREVAPGIRLTATRDVLEAVARHEQAPARFALALGCSSWGAGQLEDELKRNAWLVVEPDNAIVFGEEHDEKWSRAILSLGFDPAQLMGDMGHA